MSIDVQILGRPGEDNATLLHIDSGNASEHLLFDCGEKCLDTISVAGIQAIDHLFFSHFHMDHVCGFDTFFRLNYNRSTKPVSVWGPPGTIDLIHHRMLGYTWNLHHDQPGEWIVNELSGSTLVSAHFHTREAFGTAYREERQNTGPTFLKNANFSISVQPLNHGSIPSLAYRVDEPVRENIDPARLSELGLKPGPWIRKIKEERDGFIELGGEMRSIASLRQALLTQSPGESAAYLTDFILTPGSGEWQATCDWIRGVNTLVCEAQYRESDQDLAERNAHMTARRVGQLAADAGVGRLILQHVSRRYEMVEWQEMLAEAQSIFPASSYPESWKLGAGTSP